QDSMAVSGILRSRAVRTRVHKESSIVGLLVEGAAGTYTQSYPQVWITRSIPTSLAPQSATTVDQVVTSHRSVTDDRALRAQHRAAAARASQRDARPVRHAGGDRTIAPRTAARASSPWLGWGRSVDYVGSSTHRRGSPLKRTFQPNVRRRKKQSGFRSRMMPHGRR